MIWIISVKKCLWILKGMFVNCGRKGIGLFFIVLNVNLSVNLIGKWGKLN